MADFHIHLEAAVKAFRALEGKILLIGDDLTNVIRQSTVRIRNIVGTFKDRHFGIFIKPADSGSRGRSTSYASDNYYFH